MYEIQTIGHEEARLAIDTIFAEVSARSKAAVIAVADAYGEIIAVLRMDCSSLTSLKIAQHKAFTSAREGAPSAAVGKRLRDPDKGHEIAFFGDARYIGWGGGLPVIHNGQCLGAVAVSGLPEAEDIEVCQMAIAAIAARLSSLTTPGQ